MNCHIERRSVTEANAAAANATAATTAEGRMAATRKPLTCPNADSTDAMTGNAGREASAFTNEGTPFWTWARPSVCTSEVRQR